MFVPVKASVLASFFFRYRSVWLVQLPSVASYCDLQRKPFANHVVHTKVAEAHTGRKRRDTENFDKNIMGHHNSYFAIHFSGGPNGYFIREWLGPEGLAHSSLLNFVCLVCVHLIMISEYVSFHSAGFRWTICDTHFFYASCTMPDDWRGAGCREGETKLFD